MAIPVVGSGNPPVAYDPGTTGIGSASGAASASGTDPGVPAGLESGPADGFDPRPSDHNKVKTPPDSGLTADDGSASAQLTPEQIAIITAAAAAAAAQVGAGLASGGASASGAQTGEPLPTNDASLAAELAEADAQQEAESKKRLQTLLYPVTDPSSTQIEEAILDDKQKLLSAIEEKMKESALNNGLRPVYGYKPVNQIADALGVGSASNGASTSGV